MRSLFVVVRQPFADDLTSVLEAVEPVRVETLVSEPAVEALDEGVVDRLPGTAEEKLHAVGVRPLVEGIRDELGAVVDGDGLGVAALGCNLLEEADDASPADAAFDDDARRTAGEGVDECQDAKAVTVARGLRDEVHRPAFTGPRDGFGSLARRRCEPAAPLDADREPLGAVHAVDALVIHADSPSTKDASERPVSRSWTFGRELAEPGQQRI